MQSPAQQNIILTKTFNRWMSAGKAWMNMVIRLPHNGHYRKWRDMGRLTPTDGAHTDFRRIESDIRDMAAMAAVQSLAYDPREASVLPISARIEWLYTAGSV